MILLSLGSGLQGSTTSKMYIEQPYNLGYSILELGRLRRSKGIEFKNSRFTTSDTYWTFLSSYDFALIVLLYQQVYIFLELFLNLSFHLSLSIWRLFYISMTSILPLRPSGSTAGCNDTCKDNFLILTFHIAYSFERDIILEWVCFISIVILGFLVT